MTKTSICWGLLSVTVITILNKLSLASAQMLSKEVSQIHHGLTLPGTIIIQGLMKFYGVSLIDDTIKSSIEDIHSGGKNNYDSVMLLFISYQNQP